MTDPFDDPDWREYARHIVDELVPMISDSIATVSLAPIGETDVKFALELGLSIMLDKPIVLMIQPGQKIPARLARVADHILDYDPADPGASSERLRDIVRSIAPEEQP